MTPQNEESTPPWKLSSAIAGKNENVQRSIRLYRMWLTGALSLPGAPLVPELTSPRRLANFWITHSLLSTLAEPVRGSDELLHTRAIILLKAQILAQGWFGSIPEPQEFLARFDTLNDLGQNLPHGTIFEMMIEMMEDFEKHTAELSDDSFACIIEAVHPSDLEDFANRTCQGAEVCRLDEGPVSRPKDLSFLLQVPPKPRFCLRERADTGAANYANLDLGSRFAHIFVYPSELWGSYSKS